jgi:threonine synthase
VLTFFSHLECSVPCGAGPYDPRKLHQRCTCGAPLLARYDLTAAKRWPKSALAGREASMWRYREILPLLAGEKGVDTPLTLGEGWTPLLRVRRLGKALGLDRVFIKDESINPTGSVKSRGLAAAVTRAIHMGVRVLAMPTPASAGPAVAAYASRAGIDARIFMPKGTRTSFVRDCELSGAVLTRVDADAAAAAQAAYEKARSHAWYHLGAFQEPYRIEGEKTMGYELAEQFGWQLPDWICYPVGAGTGVVALWKAFAEMASLGWIDPVRRPHLIAAQAAGCAPLVRAHGSGADKATPWENPQTIADGLRVPDTPGDALALRALRESSGISVSVGDAEMIAAMKECGQFEGVSTSPESAAAVHAVRVLAGEGRIKPHDTVVIFNTASAARYHDLFATA